MKVYLAGPIMGASDGEAHGWRAAATEAIGEGNVLNPMARDYRGIEDANVLTIVEGDKEDIDASKAVLAFCPHPSVGTSMEVFYAWLQFTPVVAVVPPGAPVSPWLRYHTGAVVDTIEEAVALVKGWVA